MLCLQIGLDTSPEAMGLTEKNLASPGGDEGDVYCVTFRVSAGNLQRVCAKILANIADHPNKVVAWAIVVHLRVKVGSSDGAQMCTCVN